MRFRSRLLKAAYPLLRLYWRFKPYARVVRVVVRHGDDVLLVRHAYGSAAWGVPGGTLGKHEDPLEGGVRETLEETGLHLKDIRGVDGNPIDVERGELWVFVAEATSREHVIDDAEIVDARWYADGELPTEILLQARKALDAAGVRYTR